MIDGAADHSNNNLELNSPLSHLDPVSPFMLTILPRPSISSLPKHISIGVWNIRGNIPDKINEIHRFFQSSSCDILVLNETFRTPNSSWPRSHPPLLAESCSSAPTATRHPAGVAVIANRDNLHKLRSFSLLEFPCPNGTKVCLRINNFILLAVYIPPTSPYFSGHMLHRPGPSLLMAPRLYYVATSTQTQLTLDPNLITMPEAT